MDGSDADEKRPLSTTGDESPPESDPLVAVLDDRLCFRMVNRTFAHCHALTEDAVEGQTISEVLGAELVESTLAPRLRRALTGETVRFDYRIHLPQQPPRHVSAACWPVPTQSPESVVMVGRQIRSEPKWRSERTYRILLEHLDVATFLADAETGIIHDANRQAAELVDRPRDEVVGMHQSQIHPVEDQDYHRQMFRDHWEKDRLGPFEVEVLRADGSRVPVRVSAARLKIGENRYLMGFFRNLSERQRIEKELEESEARFQTLVEQIPAVTYRAAPDTSSSTLYVSPQVASLLGYQPEDLIGQPGLWAEMLHPEDRRRVLEEAARCRQTGEQLDLSYRLFHRDGSVLWVRDQAGFVRDAQGRPLVLQGVMFDITEQKEREEELAALLAFQQGMLDTAAIWINTVDTEGNVTSWNRAAERISGYSREEVLGHRGIWEWLYPDPDYRKSVFTAAMDLIREGASVENLETTIRRKDGEERVISWHSNAILDHEGDRAGTIALGADITARKEAEQKLVSYQRELRSLASELALAEQRERRNLAERLHDEVSQMLVLANMRLGEAGESASGRTADTIRSVRELLESVVGKAQFLTYELSCPLLFEVGLGAAVEELGEHLLAGHDVEFEFHADETPKPLPEDILVTLYRAARELIFNALRHAGAGKITVSVTGTDSELRVAVEDDGKGFDTEEVESCPRRNGSFGLFSIAERLTHLGGELKVESRPGHGTRAVLIAPLTADNQNEGDADASSNTAG